MIECKSHEDEAARNIIASIPTLKGVTATLDALHNQKQTMELIVKEKQGDFLLTVKKNTLQLYRFVENLFKNLPAELKKASTETIGHGRHEKRTIEVVDIDPDQSNWPHTYKAAKLIRGRDLIRNGKTASSHSETVYLVSIHQDNTTTAEKLLKLSRGHWSIENKLHHKKDRTMDEDRYRARNAVARIMSCLRSLTSLILDTAKGSLNVIQRRLTSKLHSLTQFVKCKSLDKWKLCFLK